MRSISTHYANIEVFDKYFAFFEVSVVFMALYFVFGNFYAYFYFLVSNIEKKNYNN